MKSVRSLDAQIVYHEMGAGPPVLLLHPFPANHEFWLPAAQALSRYRLILPDLRGHGDSDAGDGPATMEKHTQDLAQVLDDAGAGRAMVAGVSIGGYILFEFWRRYRERVAAVILCDTKAQADTAEGKAARLQAAEDVLQNGTEGFLDAQLPRLLGRTTIANRPDLAQAAKRMMQKMSPQDIGQVQRGMAARPDSVTTLKTMHVPALVLVGEEDVLTPVSDAELMRSNLPASQMKVISRAGHYAVWEQHEAAGAALRQFLDSLPPA